MEEQKDSRRVRLNLSQNAKGHVQIDCTAEFSTAAECGAAMRAAFDEARTIIKEKGLIEAGTV